MKAAVLILGTVGILLAIVEVIRSEAFHRQVMRDLEARRRREALARAIQPEPPKLRILKGGRR